MSATRLTIGAFLLSIFVSMSSAAPRPKARRNEPPIDPEIATLEAELQRFPASDEVRLWCSFAEAHKRYLAHRSLLYTWDRQYWRQCYCIVEEHLRPWEKLRDARCPYWTVEQRREAISELRELIGESNYWRGFIPAPAQIEMFSRAD